MRHYLIHRPITLCHKAMLTFSIQHPHEGAVCNPYDMEAGRLLVTYR